MPTSYEARTQKLRDRLIAANLDAAILTDPDSITYFAGYWNYLGLEFGRPTLLVIPVQAEPVIVTPLMESEMCGSMTWVRDIRPWSDGVAEEWRGVTRQALAGLKSSRV